MAGEGEGLETGDKQNFICSFDLTKLRDKVRVYIDTVRFCNDSVYLSLLLLICHDTILL